MDTKPLELFATRARRDLLNAVEAQATVVLSPGSVARSERADVVKKLEAEIGRRGRQHVVDKVAYTWFNRIIALRFMDARGYTNAGVVSPAPGQVHGQPEILADAKRGNLDVEVVVNTRTVEAIIGLLDGTRRSTDAEGEAYALLLTEYCRHWHTSMPFMFEREGDYTELLVPANLLAEGAILARAREVLTEDVCDDVEVLGWLYQFYISERKKEVFDGFSAKGTARRLAGPEEIPAATQLFTPHWIVRYLVENSLGRLWMLNRPISRLVDQMGYYIAPVDDEPEFLKISKPEELTVIDPACGSGHMLTYAFDLLYLIYEEEGYAPSDIPGLILAHNLHGTEIDPRAGALAAFALMMKARARQRNLFNKQVVPKICVIEPISFEPDELDLLMTPIGDPHEEEAFWNQFAEADTLGSLIRPDVHVTARLERYISTLNEPGDLLEADIIERAQRAVIQAKYLADRYAVVVANPPYMGSSSMDSALATYAKRMHPESKSDLFAMFIERCWELAADRGLIGMIAMQSWMFLPSFARLRERYGSSSQMISLVHLGAGAFDTIGGEVVSTVTWVWSRHPRPDRPAPFIDLTAVSGEAAMASAFRKAVSTAPPAKEIHIRSLSNFLSIPGGVVAYQLGKDELAAFGSGLRLGDVIELREGINTGENERFLRRWWEVDYRRTSMDLPALGGTEQKWVPYKKGGPFRKWAGNEEYVVNWSSNGAEIKASPRATPRNTQFFFRESASWSRIAGSHFSLRAYGEGFGFDSTGPSAFGSPDNLRFALAFLNSHLAGGFLRAMSPTLDFRLGNMSNLPFPHNRNTVDLSHIEELVDLARDDWDEQEFSWGFRQTPLLTVDASRVAIAWTHLREHWATRTERVTALETINNEVIAIAYSLPHGREAAKVSRVSLFCNPDFQYGSKLAPADRERYLLRDAVGDFVSFAVGCMFGRYSLDEPGLILAAQGATLQDYLAKVFSKGSVSEVSFIPDADNVIPVVDGGWFEDDIVERFRQFLRAAFGAECFEENLRFVEESLEVNTLSDYFITKAGKSKFYDDHVQRYKKRPIYWMFSSPKGSFNALIYMHRYEPSTVSTVLNEYLREYRAKLEVALANAELAEESEEADRLRRVLVELAGYEHDVLYPLATQQIVIDLDDGVKANYPKFYPALKKIPGLETAE